MKLSLRLLTAALFLLNTRAFSQNDTIPLVKEVVISEKRMEGLPFNLNSRNIQIITSADLKQMPVQSLAEAISFVCGADLRQRGPFNAQADLSLLGSTFEQVLVLIDGIPMRDPQTGHHQMNLPVDMQEIERIEILKGSAARIYGANALAGAINIVTKDPGSFKLQVQAYGGSPVETDSSRSNPYGLAGCRLSIGLGGKENRSSHQVDASFFRTDGYRYNSSNTQMRLGYRGRYTIGNGQMNVIAGAVSNSFGANGFYAYPFDKNAYETVETVFGGITYKTTLGKWKLRPLIYMRYNHDDYIFIRSKPEVYRNNHFTTAAGAEFHASLSNRGGEFGIGYESRAEIIHSNNLGHHERFYHSVYAEERFIWGQNTLTAGGQVQYTNDYGLRFYPGIEFSTPVYRQLRLFGNAGLGSRLPTYTDLYYSDSGNNGNPSLMPEEAFSGELGFKYNENHLQFTSALFIRHTTDFIDFVRTSSAEKWTPENFNQLTFRGADIRAAWIFSSTDKFIQPMLIRCAFTGMRGSLTEENAESKYALNHLSLQTISQLVVKTGSWLEHSFSFRYNERFSGQQYAVSDYRLKAAIKRFTVSGDVMNIFDRTYIESGFIPMPGRWYRLSLEWML